MKLYNLLAVILILNPIKTDTVAFEKVLPEIALPFQNQTSGEIFGEMVLHYVKYLSSKTS